jgi:hypothetical protein
MAAGEAYYYGPTSVANGSFHTLQPGVGAEIVVHNIYYGGAVEIYYSNGTNDILIDSDTGPGSRLNLTHHCTNASYVRVKNVSGSAVYIAADGMKTQ